ncbi:MAG: RnfH family protein [Mariprofundaceae bacterium]
MYITVSYALPYEQTLEDLDVPEGTTAEQAIRMSQLLKKYPEIDLQENKVGIFAKLVKLDQSLREGDRVEIYRALPKKERDPYAADDKKARILAKKKQKATETSE